jgi:ABC-type branched-subunit amino acid transport system substrate-binding protein
MGKKTGKAVKKMAALCENSIFGVSGGDGAIKYGKEVGFEVVDYSTYDAATTRDFAGYISKYKSAGVDLLVCHSRPQDSILITRTMKELNFNPLAYGGVYGHHTSTDFAESLGKDSNYVIGATSFSKLAKISRLQEFISRYEKQFKVSADGLMSYGFVILAVLKAALEKSPTYDREKLKQAIDKVEIRTGENNNLQIEGVKWAPNHDNALAGVFVIEWVNGVDNVVGPTKYATKEAVWPRPTWDTISKGK